MKSLVQFSCEQSVQFSSKQFATNVEKNDPVITAAVIFRKPIS